MKPQDIAFLAVLIGILLVRKPKFLVWAGIASLALAIPLFASWTFFTAERLTWYAAAFFLTSLLFRTPSPHKVK
jgi:hypothetical protein